MLSATYHIFPIWGNFTKLIGLFEDLGEIHLAIPNDPTQEDFRVIII